MEFIFNEYGVCLNPERIAEVPAGMGFCCIKLAQCKNCNWIWSTEIATDQYEGFGSLHPCMIEDDNVCNTRQEAILKAVEYLEQVSKANKVSYPQYTFKKLDLSIKIAREIIAPKQLTLF